MGSVHESGSSSALPFALLWLAGVSLRLTVLAVPPVIQLIRSELHLSGTQVGLLVTLPTALFALAAMPGAMLAARLGPVPTLVGGLAVTAAGAALRAVVPGIVTLLAATALMGAGIAVMQPTLPALVRRWLPERIGLATAVYSNGLLIGEIIPVALTATVVLPLVHGTWRVSLAAWSVPVLGTALVIAVAAPLIDRSSAGTTATSAVLIARPQWKSSLTWLLGLMFGGIAVTYFATNAFLPAYLASRGRPDLTPAVLTAFNAGQLPAAFMMLAMAGRWQRRASPFVVTGLLCLAAVVGMLAATGAGIAAWAALLGFAVSSAMVLALTLPVLLYPPEHVAATSAAMFTISYAGAIAAGMVGGRAWDVSGDPRWAFAPVAASAATIVGLALVLRARGYVR